MYGPCVQLPDTNPLHPTHTLREHVRVHCMCYETDDLTNDVEQPNNMSLETVWSVNYLS